MILVLAATVSAAYSKTSRVHSGGATDSKQVRMIKDFFDAYETCAKSLVVNYVESYEKFDDCTSKITKGVATDADIFEYLEDEDDVAAAAKVYRDGHAIWKYLTSPRTVFKNTDAISQHFLNTARFLLREYRQLDKGFRSEEELRKWDKFVAKYDEVRDFCKLYLSLVECNLAREDPNYDEIVEHFREFDDGEVDLDDQIPLPHTDTITLDTLRIPVGVYPEDGEESDDASFGYQTLTRKESTLRNVKY